MDILRKAILIQNQQLFSEAYVRETKGTVPAVDAVSACRRTIREWREEYPDLTIARKASLYIGQVLSALGVSYSPLPTNHGFYSYSQCCTVSRKHELLVPSNSYYLRLEELIQRKIGVFEARLPEHPAVRKTLPWRSPMAVGRKLAEVTPLLNKGT